MTARIRIAILDDSQNIAEASADWRSLRDRADVVIMRDPFANEDAVAAALADFDIIIPMRERTPLPGTLLNRLPKLKMIALTGARSPSLDLAACAARGIHVSNTTGDESLTATAELAFALILACARDLGRADANMHGDKWHDNLRMGISLGGKRIGIVGLGKLGSRVAGYARAFGMDVVAWSQNLTAKTATAAGAKLVSKAELFATADVVSVHLVLSPRSRNIIGAAEIEALKPGAILVNTSRGPLVDRAALLARLGRGDIVAGLDVYDQEPLPKTDPLRALPNVVLTPHLGYSSDAVYRQFYGQSVENILSFLDGKPIRELKAG